LTAAPWYGMLSARVSVALREQGHFDEAIKRLEQVVAEAPYEPRAEQELTRTRELKQNSATK
jgi:hypothetical protein